MTALDDAVETLQALMERYTDAARRTTWAAYSTAFVTSSLRTDEWTGPTKQALIAELAETLPGMVAGSVGLVADQVAGWYDALAPDEQFAATVPPEIVPDERIIESIGWAIRTAVSAETALAQLAGSVDRMVMDAQRTTVAHNAAAEGIRYRRHTNYAGACNWCCVMATRGAVYASAASAVRGHDNCRCIAVPERPGTSYTVPKMVRDAEAKYAAVRQQLEAEGVTPTLDNVVKRMGSIGATPDR